MFHGFTAHLGDNYFGNNHNRLHYKNCKVGYQND